jgi:hypothetical protein
MKRTKCESVRSGLCCERSKHQCLHVYNSSGFSSQELILRCWFMNVKTRRHLMRTVELFSRHGKRLMYAELAVAPTFLFVRLASLKAWRWNLLIEAKWWCQISPSLPVYFPLRYSKYNRHFPGSVPQLMLQIYATCVFVVIIVIFVLIYY